MTSPASNGHAGRPSLAAHASPWRNRPWSGVYPATLCPFHDDESVDEEGLVASIEDVASVPGIEGVVCNGHTGEIMSLSPAGDAGQCEDRPHGKSDQRRVGRG
jgi:hypothetical protein